MATIYGDEALNKLDELYRRYHGRSLGEGDIRSLAFGPNWQKDQRSTSEARSILAGRGVNAEDFVRNAILPSNEYRGNQRQFAESQYAPLLSNIERERQSSEAESDALLRALERRKSQLPEEISGEFAKRGLLRSSQAGQRVTDALADLSSNIGSVQANRALRLADLASQKSAALKAQTDLETNLIKGAYDQLEAEKLAEIDRQKREASFNQFVTSGGRNQLINTLTGETVRDLGSSRDGLTPADLVSQAPGLLQNLNPDDDGDFNIIKQILGQYGFNVV